MSQHTDKEKREIARVGFLDLLFCLQQANFAPNPRQRHRIAAAWDCVRRPEDTPLKFYEKDEKRIILPIGPSAHMPGLRG